MTTTRILLFIALVLIEHLSSVMNVAAQRCRREYARVVPDTRHMAYAKNSNAADKIGERGTPDSVQNGGYA